VFSRAKQICGPSEGGLQRRIAGLINMGLTASTKAKKLTVWQWRWILALLRQTQEWPDAA